MTYQGERARAMANETGRSFVVSKVRIGADGHVTEVLWGEVARAANREVGDSVVAAASEVVDAIHDGARVSAVFPTKAHLPPRDFVVIEHEDGRECIAFDDEASPGRAVTDMVTLKP